MKSLRKNENNYVICEICGKSFKYKKGLSKHLSYTHKIDTKMYYDKWVKDENEDKCKICNNSTNFRSFRDGYTKLCSNCLYKSRYPSQIGYWLCNGFSKEESVKKVSKFQKTQEKKVKNHTNDATIKYWVEKGFSKEEAIEKIKERQTTFSLKKCIDKYGENEGKLIFNKRQLKWQKTLNDKSPEEKIRINKLKGITLENMIRKWGEIDGPEKYNDWKCAIRGGVSNISKISQELFYELLKNIDDKENVKFGKHNKEFYIIINNKIFYYDFKYKNKIIEFNGDLFHANPQMFNENDTPNFYRKDLTAKQIWESDNKKINNIKNKGYDVHIVWGKDYFENKQKSIDACLIFLNQ